MRGDQFLHWIKYHLGLEAAATQTTDAEREALRSYAKDRQCLVEIGVFEGVTSRVLRETMSSRGILTCVDPFVKGQLGISYGFSISRQELAKSHNGSVRFLRCLSHEAAVDWSMALDFIFIDGDHSDEGVGRDWRDWSPFVSSGGMVAFHDSVGPESASGPPALVRKIRRSDPRFQFVDQVDSLTIFQRREEGEKTS